MNEPTITCINGRFAQAHRAAVPLADRGFRFGDGLFETIRVEGRVPYQWARHMERLAQGMHAIGLVAEIPWEKMARKTMEKNAMSDGFLRLAVSRGVGSRGYLPFPADMPVTYAIEALPALPAPEKPYRMWLTSWAKIPANCLPGKFKLAQGMNSILALQDATAQGCNEALQLTTDGIVSEAASANIFWLKDGALHTPSLDTNCLGGITRESILRLSHLPVRVVNAGLAVLEGAEALFLTNARLGVHLVSSVQPMGWEFATRHPDIELLQRALADDRQRDRKRHTSQWIG